MTNVKNYLFQNRIQILILLLSMLIMTPWTQCNRIEPPSFLRPVALSKNFYQPHLIPDDDHQPSDYWWDDTKLHKLHSNITQPSITAIPSLLLDPPTSDSTLLHKSPPFSPIIAAIISPLSPHLAPPHSPHTCPLPSPKIACHPTSGPNSKNLISPQNNTTFKFKTFYCSHRLLKPSNQKSLTTLTRNC